MVKVFAPATVANVAAGFDIFGFAINEPGDIIVARLTEKPGVVITKITGDNGKLPYEPDKNSASVSVLSYMKYIKSKRGVELEIHKGMPLYSGLGSSAASAVGGVFAVNTLFGERFKREQLLQFAIEGEKVASGSLHADNVAPSLLGGFILIRSYIPLDIVHIPVPDDLLCTIVTPEIEIPTEKARKILRSEISMKDAIIQWGNASALIAGLFKKDYELIRRSLQDVVAEPVRSTLIPGFNEVKRSAIESGALGCSISGSGPSVFALSRSQKSARIVGTSMKKTFESIGLNCKVYISKINVEGVKVVKN